MVGILQDHATHYFVEISIFLNTAKIVQTYRYPGRHGGQDYKETIVNLGASTNH